MPRVRGFTTRQKLDFQMKHTAESCEILLLKNRISKKDVAEFVGISPSAVCHQFKERRITLEVLISVISLTNVDPEGIKNLLVVKDAK
jgi:hypothetical protein